MKWTKLCGAFLAAAGMMGTAFAGTCAPLATGHAGDKSTGCAPAYQPCASKPVICRPDYRKVCSYQRSCTKQTLNGCNIGNHGAHAGAGGAGGSCVTAAPSHGAGNGGSCGTNAGSCGLPTSCGPKKCGLLGGLGNGGLLGGLFNCKKKSCDTGCAPAAKAGC
ncbi:MAG: hypothetical protein ACKOFW_14185, partial [Planctomycetaceae bacterium]